MWAHYSSVRRTFAPVTLSLTVWNEQQKESISLPPRTPAITALSQRGVSVWRFSRIVQRELHKYAQSCTQLRSVRTVKSNATSVLVLLSLCVPMSGSCLFCVSERDCFFFIKWETNIEVNWTGRLESSDIVVVFRCAHGAWCFPFDSYRNLCSSPPLFNSPKYSDYIENCFIYVLCVLLTVA